MRFKEGSRVEVLRKKKEAYGSWFPAKVLSKINNMYTISYELYLTGKGEPLVEKVHEKDIRPCPPVSLEVESWVLGDIAEVLDLCSWRVGKIAKALKNNYFVVRLFGSIQLKRFHISNLRVRQAWQHNRWISLEKGSGKKNAIDNAFPDDTEGRVNKRRGTLNAEPFSNDLLNQNIVEEDIECSVASCSANDLPKFTVQNNRTTKSCREISDTSFHAASSSFASIPGKKEELAENVHELELHAYKSTVQALYASGPLSWEQESLLTNLRMCLHISNEEHLLQVRNLLSA